MTDETEALRKRVEELEREVGALRGAIKSVTVPVHSDYYSRKPSFLRRELFKDLPE